MPMALHFNWEEVQDVWKNAVVVAFGDITSWPDLPEQSDAVCNSIMFE